MKLKTLILLFIFGIIISSCGGKDEPNKPKEPTSRTILVYMVANNSLGSYGYDDNDILEMQTAATTSGFNNGRLIIYHASTTGAPALKEITADGIVELKQYDNYTYSTDPERLEEVIQDTYAAAPALDYGLILWSHSDAWVEHANSKSLSESNVFKPLAFGEDRQHYMKISSLANVLNRHNFSFIYFDCCHMASVEVAYELRHATKHIIASAAELPAAGMPYDQNLPALFSSTADLQQACLNTFNYYNEQSGQSRTCTISLIATEHLDELAAATREIFRTGAALPSNYSPQKYFRYGTSYLCDFEHYINALSPSTEMLTQWKNALYKTVLYEDATPAIFGSLVIATHCGLGCYIVKDINDSTTKGYNNNLWWNDVVQYNFK